VQPEADNPGQILWIMGEHWKFTRNREWLTRVYPSAKKIGAMIRYYRTTPEPHWVADDSLEFGDALPETARKRLKPGACDGFHPEYTEAFDIAGLRALAALAGAAGEGTEAAAWRQLAETFFYDYNNKFGTNLANQYGSYSVLWPCRIYPTKRGPAWEQFRSMGAQEPKGWRYFPLAKAHQGFLAGDRFAGCDTIEKHLNHPQMQGWYAFDEGGDSGVGGWNQVLTTWRQGTVSDAMPHGWAIAEFQLLLRDCLVYEDDESLVLAAGVPETWFQKPFSFDLPTAFGNCDWRWSPSNDGATLKLTGTAKPPGGFVVQFPEKLGMKTKTENVRMMAPGEFTFPASVHKVEFRVEQRR
jgi:hypothetical protein